MHIDGFCDVPYAVLRSPPDYSPSWGYVLILNALPKGDVMRRSCLYIVAAAAMLVACAQPAAATSVIVNGDFETGDTTGWQVVCNNPPGILGDFAVQAAPVAPVNGYPTVGPAGGEFYAASGQNGGGVRALLQQFTIGASSSVHLSFDMFTNNFAGSTIVTGTLDAFAGPNQYARVDILAVGAAAPTNPLTTGVGLLANLYSGADLVLQGPNPYAHYDFDITSIVGGGGSFILRFAEVDNQFLFTQGVDNVYIGVDENGSVVPEPITMLGVIAGIGSIAGYIRRRRIA
jgi:hypothetical protein